MCAENHHFIDRCLIAQMKTGAFLINTSRGSIVDTQALTDALVQNHLAGAALDVYENEPYEGTLTKLDNVILTAHIGASARQSRRLMELGATEDCIRVLNGEQPNNDAVKDVFECLRTV
jgi:D-3-phosphoglycerate dehydrogenase